MPKSVIFNEPQIKSLQAGTLSAFVIKNPNGMTAKHCPYQVGQRIFVKEKFCFGCEVEADTMKASNGKPLYFDTANIHEWYHENDENCTVAKFKPATHLLEKDARFHLEITSVKAVRCQDMEEHNFNKIGFDLPDKLKHVDKVVYKWYFIYKYGEDFWTSNSWLWYNEFKLVNNG